MNANLDNKNGHVWLRKGRSVRASVATVTVRDCEFDCEYIAHGSYIPATETDAAETPWVELKSAQIHGVEMFRWMSDEQRSEIEQAIEARWVTA